MIGQLILCATLLSFELLAQQKYTGPKPDKPDVPFLMHADSLVATEVGEAQEQQGKKDEVTYMIPGANSSAKTPLASPVFLIHAEKIDPQHLQLFRLESKNGHREITFRKKGRNNSPALQLTVSHLDGNLYQVEAVDSLPNGEYSLTPEG